MDYYRKCMLKKAGKRALLILYGIIAAAIIVFVKKYSDIGLEVFGILVGIGIAYNWN